MAADHLIFDLDGTISDPAEGILRSINYALAGFGHTEIASSEVSEYIGPPIDVSFRKLTGAPEAHVRALVASFRERYADVGFAENTLYPGVAEALTTLAARGIPLGVCTSKRVDLAAKVLAHFGLRRVFRFVSGGDVGVMKSDQVGRLLADGEIAAGSCMIGDRAVDVQAARSHALYSVGVLWGHGSRHELAEAGAELLLAEPEELVALADQVAPPSIHAQRRIPPT